MDRVFCAPVTSASRLPGFNNSRGPVAQLAEHSTLNRQVVGSIPTGSTILNPNEFRQISGPAVLDSLLHWQNLTKNLAKLFRRLRWFELPMLILLPSSRECLIATGMVLGWHSTRALFGGIIHRTAPSLRA
jgi:hypothetical protein